MWQREENMERTFNTKLEATEYQEQEMKAGGVAVVGKFGDKFRVYVSTKENLETSAMFWNKETPEQNKQRTLYHLRDKAFKVGNEIDNALKLRKMMKDNSIYDKYEFAVEAAHIMVEDAQEFKSAKDVLDFIDYPQKHDKAMTEYIEAVLNDYEYETTPDSEVTK